MEGIQNVLIATESLIDWLACPLVIRLGCSRCWACMRCLPSLDDRLFGAFTKLSWIIALVCIVVGVGGLLLLCAGKFLIERRYYPMLDSAFIKHVNGCFSEHRRKGDHCPFATLAFCKTSDWELRGCQLACKTIDLRDWWSTYSIEWLSNQLQRELQRRQKHRSRMAFCIALHKLGLDRDVRQLLARRLAKCQ